MSGHNFYEAEFFISAHATRATDHKLVLANFVHSVGYTALISVCRRTAKAAFTHSDRYANPFANRFANRSSLRLHRGIGLHTGMHTGFANQASKHCIRIWPRPLASLRNVYDAVSAACRWKRSTRSNIYI